MNSPALHSGLAQPLQRFLDLRRLAGTDYESQARLLRYFDQFLETQGVTEPRLTREIIEAYHQSLAHLRPRTQANRYGVVRQFCEYLSRTDPQSYVPERLRGTRAADAHPPHIYSPTEIQNLLAAAAQLAPAHSLRPHTYRTLFGLLYSTGLRIGEACALNLEDYHEDQQSLYIAEGKFHKARWVPLSASAREVLRQYLQRRQRLAPCTPDAPLLLNLRGRRLRHPTVYHTFRDLLRQCGIPHGPQAGPRIHDLRHTFAVHRVLAWYRDGQDVNARLPWLATYLGHVGISSTQVYLRATAELLEQVDQRFHQHYLQHIQSRGATP
jgi:site-specific recombinase XerD